MRTSEILTREQPFEGGHRVLKAFHHIFPILDLALPQPLRHVSFELRRLFVKVVHHEAAKGQPLGEHCPHQQWHAVRPTLQPGRIIVRNQPAYRHAPE
jgi:hypothetical protein